VRGAEGGRVTGGQVDDRGQLIAWASSAGCDLLAQIRGDD
jgi:hypothetical protein